MKFYLFVFLSIVTYHSICQNEVDVSTLKKSKDFFVTSSTLSKKDCTYFIEKKSKNHFFGRYYFVEKINKDVLNAYTLTVEDTVKSWKYDSKSELFVELTCISGSIRILKNIQIGTDINSIDKQLGKPLLIKNGYYIYNSNNRFYTFYVLNGKVKKYRVGMYNAKVLDEKFTKYLTSFD